MDEIAIENCILHLSVISKITHTKVTGHGYRSNSTKYSAYSFLCSRLTTGKNEKEYS